MDTINYSGVYKEPLASWHLITFATVITLDTLHLLQSNDKRKYTGEQYVLMVNGMMLQVSISP